MRRPAGSPRNSSDLIASWWPSNGASREAAELYSFDETRQALYEGAKRAVAAIGRCQPYKLSLPIQAKKEHLVFEEQSKPGRKVTKEGTIADVLKLLEF
jgi:D-amino peptidase